jgi:hypothetical protein
MSSRSSSIGAITSAGIVNRATAGLVSDLYEALKQSGNKQFAKWRISGGARLLQSRLNRFRKVKTILHMDRAVDLTEFYYPTKVDTGRSPPDYVSRSDELFHTSGPVLVTGHVGQGKSIFLRYLAARDIVESAHRIPLFVELRDIRRRSLHELLVSELAGIGFAMPTDMFDFLAISGRFRFYLDGFDEVDETEQSRVICELQEAIRRYEQSRFIISSRPTSNIASSPWLTVASICRYNDWEIPDLVERLADEHSAKGILRQLKNKGLQTRELLTTPLMIALLIVRYRIEQTVPETDIAFFGDLFDLLLRRHDQGKAGFRRKRKSTIGDYDLERVFNGLCFFTRRRGSADEFRLRELHEAISWVCKSLSINDNPDAIANDIITITNLILEEGGYCRFIHKSIQEFHAASFVAMIGGDFAKQFYETAFKRGGWEQEIRFLKQLDRPGFERHLLLPTLNTILARSTFGTEWMSSTTGVKDEFVIDRVANARILLLLDGYLDEYGITLTRPALFAEKLKVVRNRVAESVANFNALSDDFLLASAKASH